jgi:hypothetical protein
MTLPAPGRVVTAILQRRRQRCCDDSDRSFYLRVGKVCQFVGRAQQGLGSTISCAKQLAASLGPVSALGSCEKLRRPVGNLATLLYSGMLNSGNNQSKFL